MWWSGLGTWLTVAALLPGSPLASAKDRSAEASVVVVEGEVEEPARKAYMENFLFRPEELRVAAGEKVQWVNLDQVEHDVVVWLNGGDSVASDLVGYQGRITIQFNSPGTYDYVCSPHPFMGGRVVVTQ